MRDGFKNYFNLTKSEWNGAAGLLVLIVIINLAPSIYSYFYKPTPPDFGRFESLSKVLSDSSYKKIANTRHKFNPNQANDTDWEAAGLTGHQIEIIKHYLSKGGHFSSVNDLSKIYGLTDSDMQRIKPLLSLPNAYDKPDPVIEINSADSAKFTKLKGIGPAFAMRIIRYRDKIGGFYKKEQLKEVFGIDEERYHLVAKRLLVNTKAVKKLNINKASFEDLRRYPYLTYKQINAILQYSKEHGDYESFDDLKEVAILDASTLQKVRPYWVFK